MVSYHSCLLKADKALKFLLKYRAHVVKTKLEIPNVGQWRLFTGSCIMSYFGYINELHFYAEI